MARAQAFSLVELLVVMGIVGALSAVAIPSYNKYIVKARVMELLVIADSYKVKLVENLFNNEPQYQSVYNLNSKLVDYVAVNTVRHQPAKHVIQVVAKMKNSSHIGIGLVQPDSAAEGLAIQLHGQEVGDMIQWSCHVALDYNKYVPKNCQNNDIEAISVG